VRGTGTGPANNPLCADRPSCVVIARLATDYVTLTTAQAGRWAKEYKLMDLINILIAAVSALATAVATWILIRQFYTQKKKFRLFISIQMNDLTNEEYEGIQKEILDILEFAKSLENVESVYYFNRNYPTKKDFIEAKFDVGRYMKNLDECDYFLGVFFRRIHSSIYAEAGYALAKGKKCILYTRKDQNTLPSVLKGSIDIFENVKEIQFDDIKHIARKLKEYLPHLGNSNHSQH